MSEVVPLPSFGEVFFDERGQERVLRVTWHEGTLVLSLWRGEMCSASFRMPMQDVGRLVDTLDEGFVEAGGQYPDEVGEQHPPAGDYQEHGEFPGTGQYARPRPEDYAQQQYADPAATQVSPPPDEPRPAPAPALGPNDVLVARGAVPPLDRSHERPPAGYGPADVVPRENLIVGDSLPYGQAAPVEPHGSGPGEPLYQMSGDPYAAQQPDPYGMPSQQPDAYAAQQPADPYAAQQPDAYGVPSQQPDPYASQQPDPYGVPPQQPVDPYAATQAQRRPDSYGAPAQQPVDPFAPPAGRQQPVDPFAPHAEQFPSSARQPHADPYAAQQQHSTDPFGFAAQQQQQSAYGSAQPDAYGYPAPAQPDPYAFGAQQPAPQAGHPADLRDLYGSPPSYQQDVDPSDPLGLGGQQADQRMPRPYVDPPHSTGERLRPEPRYDDQRYDERRPDDRDERRDW
ncbi:MULTISPECIES: hypothetical protein [Streptosporangium]|uniref:Uncharacterized protein n=1 Tax=Streptosporangium brasiliense TaxID=47480 RepID=A0ABT9RD63_9ACTN|nr:hypothetical protein [Streptosporangium brasiliense]MDP9866811.1 hypothetical protein [Streptosporangium brasiliense]